MTSIMENKWVGGRAVEDTFELEIKLRVKLSPWVRIPPHPTPKENEK